MSSDSDTNDSVWELIPRQSLSWNSPAHSSHQWMIFFFFFFLRCHSRGCCRFRDPSSGFPEINGSGQQERLSEGSDGVKPLHGSCSAVRRWIEVKRRDVDKPIRFVQHILPAHLFYCIALLFTRQTDLFSSPPPSPPAASSPSPPLPPPLSLCSRAATYHCS